MLGDDELRRKMALVLPADVVEAFFGMWTGTIIYDAVDTGVDRADQLDPAAVAGQPAVTLIYDPIRGEQHLAYRGVLFGGGEAAPGPGIPRPRDARPATPSCSTPSSGPPGTSSTRICWRRSGSSRRRLRPLFTPPAPDTDDAELQETAAKRSGWSRRSCRTCATG